MNHGALKSSASGRQEWPDTEDRSARNDREDESRELKVSADIYAHRSTTRKARQRGDWWIAIGVYLLLASVALVIF